MENQQQSKSVQIVSAFEVEGGKVTLSFRGSANKRFLYQTRVVGFLAIDEDLTAVVTNSTSGLMAFAVGSEATGWKELYKELSGDAGGIVQKHLDQTLALFQQSDEPEEQDEPGSVGLLFTDGVFVTVQVGSSREHFALNDAHLPSVQGFEITNDQLGIRVALQLPDSGVIELTITGADNVIAAERAITLLRRRSGDQKIPSFEFKVPPSRDQNWSQEDPKLHKESSPDFRNAPGDPGIYDSAVSLVYPYLAGATRIANAPMERADEVSGASYYLVQYSKTVRGQSFETLRSLSVSRTRQMMNDPRDSLAAKLVGRVMVGKGDDDASVYSMIETEVRQLQVDATMRYVQAVLDNNPLTDQRIRDKVNGLFISDILGKRVSAPIGEEQLSRALESYKTSIVKTLTTPGVVGNVMASRGSFDLAAMRKADKRNSKGRYSSTDLEMMASVAASYRNVFKVVARLQRAMGWQPIEWDPVDFVIALGQGR